MKLQTRLIFLGILFFFSSTGFLWSQNAAKRAFGNGIEYLAKDTSFSAKFNLRMQNLYVYNYDEASETSSSQFLVRRARLKFGGFALTKNLKYKVELGLSNRDISIDKEDGNGRGGSRMILDAVLQWQFSKHWSLWVGQTKLPGNRERVISSADLQFVDRSLVNSKYNLDRDAGIQLRGRYSLGSMIVEPAVAVSQGEGRNITSQNFGGYDYTLHLDIQPLGAFSSKKGAFTSSDLDREPAPKLALGFTYDYNDGAVRQGGQLGKFISNSEGVYMENSLQTLIADLMFKYRGLSVLSEYASKSADKKMSDLSSGFNTGTGLTVQMGYLFHSNWEMALRYTTIEREDDFSSIKDENQFTLGLSKYIVGHKLKVQSDFTRVTFPDRPDGGYQFRMQVEMQF
ncbi:MAG: OprO/OprP family phosphate-selective porin [Saprospiraceae bacterium]|nr:OprO/OprP family phosphate-selective porin [Saprospiraceae bacterium]